MIVTNQKTQETQLERQNRKEAQTSSDRFARLVDKHARQQRESDAVTRRMDKAEMVKERETAVLHANAPIRDSGSEVPAGNTQTANAELDKAKEPAPNTPAHIHRLAEELGQQIELHRTAGSPHSIDITFHSRSLSELQVRIREIKGALAIRFISPSASTSRLLSRHAQSLKDSLANRGLNIRDIVIANDHAPVKAFEDRFDKG